MNNLYNIIFSFKEPYNKINRTKFVIIWITSLILFAFSAVFIFGYTFSGGGGYGADPVMQIVMNLLFWLSALLFISTIIASITTTLKRLKDIGLDWFYIFILFVPIISVAFLLFLFFKKSKSESVIYTNQNTI